MFDDARLGNAIAEIGAEVPDARGLRRARRLFALALETPGGLKIQTIHSFCERLLGRFPIEAGVPPAFRVLDEQTSRDLIAEARAQVLERAGSGDAELAAAVAHIVTEASETPSASDPRCRAGAMTGASWSASSRELAGGRRRVAASSPSSAHGVNPGDTVEERRAANSARRPKRGRGKACAASRLAIRRQARRIASLRGSWLRLSDARFSTDAFRALRDVFCTDSGEPRASLATKALCEGATGAVPRTSTVSRATLRRRRAALPRGPQRPRSRTPH